MRRVEAEHDIGAPARWRAWFDPGAAALGSQMAVAGAAAFFCAQWLRLDYPGWSVFTVIMLLMAEYVGAVEDKAVFRMIGTVAGGVLGYLATSGWQQSPVIYLSAAFAISAFSVAMFGQSRAPYAFLLTGLTFVVIAANSQQHPQEAWSYALSRVEEVLLGVIASVIVQSTIFPRYANRDFRQQLAATLGELAGATPRATARFSRAHSGLGAAMRDFPTRAAAMRTLLRFGSRESLGFRRELGTHAETVTILAHAANLLRSLELAEPAPEPYRSELGGLVNEASEHLRRGWMDLRRAGALDAGWRDAAADLHRRRDEALLGLRSDPRVQALPAEQIAVLSAHLLVLRELGEALTALDDLWRQPPRPLDLPDRLALAPAWPGPFWIRQGVRTGLTFIIALVLENWLNPPGGSFMALSAFSFGVLNALSPEGSGDRGAFGYVVIFTAVMACVSIALVAGTPLLASYAVLNIVLVSWLFLLGYWIHDRGGITVPVQVSFFTLISILALNAQEPVAFQSITGVFFGLVNGLLIASVIQRSLWPVLPQEQLRSGLTEYLSTVAEGLPDGLDKLPIWRRAKLAMFPTRARTLIAVMRGPALPADEAARLEEFVLTLQKLTGEIFLCAGRLRLALGPSLAYLINDPLESGKAALLGGLEQLASGFATMRAPADITHDIDALLVRWDEALAGLRSRLVEENTTPGEAILYLGLAARYRHALVLLRLANREARQLHPAGYLGDVAL